MHLVGYKMRSVGTNYGLVLRNGVSISNLECPIVILENESHELLKKCGYE